jgi:N-acetylglucosamine-6-phosphate deacetylase
MIKSSLPEIDLQGDILAPAYVDLQVNGGGGVMFNDDPSPDTLARIAAAHRGLGTGSILPTLITDTAERTRAAIDAVCVALHAGMDGIGGLHLEGPHIAPSRKGAHDGDLIRPMGADDLAMLLGAAERIPHLMVTLAPESVSPDQVARLAGAGILVSLGHSDADYDTAMAYQRAGARAATHLFNAMSPLTSRAPGLVGAALANGGLSAGLIADGHHVHPATLRLALAAKAGPGALFLVSDAMAPAGMDMREFHLNGRRIRRHNGRLTLDDGTLAGADLDLTQAVNCLVARAGASLAAALAMTTSVPARLIGLPAGIGTITPGTAARLIRLARTDAGLAIRPAT